MKYFGTDGIRGVFPDFLTPQVAYKLGFALTRLFAHCKNKTILIANDGRTSGHCLETALASGILAGGFNAEFLGLLSSSGLAYLVKDTKVTAGVMVSASHNPPEYNGLKIFNCKAEKISDNEEKQLEKLMKTQNLKADGDLKQGRLKINYSLKNKYIKFLKGLFNINGNTAPAYIRSICIGAGYGGASEVCRKVFSKLNINTHFFACKSEGEKINSEYSAVSMEKLCEEVIKTGSDFGFCLDGDADRIMAIDEKGGIVDGDKILFVLAKYLLKADRLVSKKVVGTNFSNTGIKQALKEQGVKFYSAKVGDKFVIKKLLEIKSELGGEASGHIILSEYLHTGDGVLAAIMLINAIELSEKPLSKLSGEFKPFIYKTANVNVSPKFKKTFKKNKKFKEFKKQCDELIVTSGRIIIRASGTEPVMRILVEGTDEKLCCKLLEIIKNKIISLDTQ